jgi:AcrR family transcriptional regulator
VSTAAVRRPRLDREQVVVAAEAIVDEAGWDGLTMAALAVRLGMRAPSLYNHVANIEALRAEVQNRTMLQLGRELANAAMGRAGRDGFAEMALTYRSYARRYPHRYDGVTRAPIDRDAFGAAAEPANAALSAIVRSYGVEPDEILLAQLAVFASLHGAVALEINGFFANVIDPDRLYDSVVDAADRHLLAFAAAS